MYAKPSNKIYADERGIVMDIIEVSHLKKKYGAKTAVDDLSFTVKKGEIFGLLGHNGAGKSTTIECILGLKTYDSGNVSILGMQAAKSRKQLFEHVGVQLQNNCYQDKIKVAELCQETAVLYESGADYKELLKKFGLDTFEKQYVANLSGGEKQKLSIVLALLPKPELVFFDELTTGLDTAARREVWKILRELKTQGLTVFITSHYMDEVEALCDRICIIKEGKKIVSGTVAEVVANSPYDKLEEAYLWYMGEEVEA
jgi:ABC-2 type transport system ATP-binding protein